MAADREAVPCVAVEEQCERHERDREYDFGNILVTGDLLTGVQMFRS